MRNPRTTYNLVLQSPCMSWIENTCHTQCEMRWSHRHHTNITQVILMVHFFSIRCLPFVSLILALNFQLLHIIHVLHHSCVQCFWLNLCFGRTIELDNMNLNDSKEILRTLALGIEYDYKKSQPLQLKPHFLWEPLP
jgi:hypothetical protein